MIAESGAGGFFFFFFLLSVVRFCLPFPQFIAATACQCKYCLLSLLCSSYFFNFAVHLSTSVHALSPICNCLLLLLSELPGFALSSANADASVYIIGLFFLFSLTLMCAHSSLICRRCVHAPCRFVRVASF